jgi:hypothetical protein
MIGGWVVIILFLVWLSVVTGKDLSAMNEMAKGKAWATATVTLREKGYLNTASSSYHQADIFYSYTVAGRPYRSFTPVDDSVYQSTPVGSQIAINYLPSDPSRSAYLPDEVSRHDSPYRFALIPLIGVGFWQIAVNVNRGRKWGWNTMRQFD